MTWQYITGFFDGEGSIVNNGKGFRITISQTNEDVLKLIEGFSGVGNVFKVTKRKKHWRDAWVFYIAKQEDVLNFLLRIESYAIVKKALIQKAIAKLKITVEKQHIKEKVREERRKRSIFLREHGLTYREIGRELNADCGYIRRLILGIR